MMAEVVSVKVPDALTTRAIRYAQLWKEKEKPFFEALCVKTCTCRIFQPADRTWLAFPVAAPGAPSDPQLSEPLFIASRRGQFVSLSKDALIRRIAHAAEYIWLQRGYQVRWFESVPCVPYRMILPRIVRGAAMHDEVEVLIFAIGIQKVYTVLWFHHDRNTVTIEIIHSLKCPYTRFMRRNMCVILAMQQLLNNPDWDPPEIDQIVREHGGVPHRMLHRLTAYAPVVVWDIPFQMFEGETLILIEEDDGEVDEMSEKLRKMSLLHPEDKILVGYQTGNAEGHCICTPARNLFRIKKDIYFLIHLKKT